MQGLPVLMKEPYGPNLQRYRLALRKIDFSVQCHYVFLHGAFYPEGGVMMQACQAAASLVLHCQCNVLKPHAKHTPIMLDVGVCSFARARARSASKRPVLSLDAAVPQGG